MSDVFWGGLFMAVPAIVASVLAYRKSEQAVQKAENTEKVLRQEIKNGNGIHEQDVMNNAELTRAVRLLVQEMAQCAAHIHALNEFMEKVERES